MKRFLFKKHLLLPMVFALLVTQGWGQVVTLPSSPSTSYTENFDGMGTGTTTPNGWTVRTGANASSRGSGSTTVSIFAATASNGAFDNFASASPGSGRALGIRQTGSLGDPGAAFEVALTSTAGKKSFSLSVVHLILSEQTRTTVWSVQYSTNGTAWSTIGTFNGTTTSQGTATYSFGTGLDDINAAVYIRVAALSASTGSGSRDSYALDNFVLSWTNIPPPTSAATDYFRSSQSGNWATTSSWQSSSNGTSNWITATLAPDNNSAGITIQNSHNITVAADVTADNLTVAAGGTLTVNSGTNLTINNGTGTDLDIFGTVNNSGVITPTNAAVVVETGGLFALVSASPTATGAIGNVGTGSITGTVTAQQNLTAQRAYRLLGHPFNSNIAISNLQSAIDITGSGTGLTAGNASAFNYLTGAWTAYTDASQTWDKNQALFLFVRGISGEGIGQTTGTYIPSVPTISLSGSVNTGDVDYIVKSVGSFGGTAEGWNAIGNPYPAPIDVNAISGITLPGGSGASVYVWNATMGSTNPGIASGGYDFQTLGSSFVIPAYGAFFIKNTNGTDQSITFRESIKSVSGASPVYAPFGGSTTPAQSFLLTIADSLTYWDKLKINFDSKSNTASTDRLDMDKFSNINLDFYSIASDSKHLAINNRPVLQSATDVIALGLKTNQQRTFTVKASDVSLADGSNLYLHDKYTNNWVKIANGMSYDFSVTADTASQGNNRFEIAAKAEPVVVSAPAALTVQAGPNPVNSVLTITYASPEVLQTNIRITDINGKTVASINAGKVQSGVQQVAAGTWSTGVYVIQVNNGKEVVTKKIVKQ